MATWSDVTNYVKANFAVEYETARALGLIFRFEDGRTQKITLSLSPEADAFGGRWAKLTSLVAPLTASRLAKAAEIAGGFHCGGIAIVKSENSSWIVVQDTFRIDEVNVNEIFEPLHTIVATADILEKQLTGRDIA